eukprot:gene11020-3090_t
MNSQVPPVEGPLSLFSGFRGKRTVGHVNLQALIFYQSTLFVLWALVLLASIALQQGSFGRNIIRTAIYIVMVALETPRLALGYIGNRREQVLTLMAFTFLTVTQSALAVVSILLIDQQPLEHGAHIVYTFLIFGSLITCVPAIVSINRDEVARFALLYWQLQENHTS